MSPSVLSEAQFLVRYARLGDLLARLRTPYSDYSTACTPSFYVLRMEICHCVIFVLQPQPFKGIPLKA